jgi:hypothetical protein
MRMMAGALTGAAGWEGGPKPPHYKHIYTYTITHTKCHDVPQNNTCQNFVARKIQLFGTTVDLLSLYSVYLSNMNR